MSVAVAGQRTIQEWIAVMTAGQLPVLGSTLREMSKLRADEENVRPRDLSQLVLHDPLMAVRVLRFLKDKQRNRAMREITTVEHAIMMLGVSPFFRNFSKLRAVNTDLAANSAALLGLMTVIWRARHATVHAREWALLRHDMDSDEVAIATLLHDMAEMLLWYFAPQQAGEIDARLAENSEQRSTDVQRHVLGFSLNELQLALVTAWQLPPILTSLMDDYRAERPRARNVLFAVNLARHAGNGWEDPALSNDIEGIRKLIGRPLPEVQRRIFFTALAAGLDRSWYDERTRALWLPPYPVDFGMAESAPGPKISLRLLEKIKKVLADESNEVALADGPLENSPLSALPAVVALVFYGLYKGLGLARQAYFEVDASGQLAQVRFLGGVRDSGRLSNASLPLGMANAATRQLAEQGFWWWKGTADDRALSDLPNAWRSYAGKGFYAGMIRTPDGRGGVLLTDSAEDSDRMTEHQFAGFRDLCALLSLKLAGPLPEAAPSNESNPASAQPELNSPKSLS
ncbi:MAG: HDOD domain-containing protein [Burkholderiales bacterium]